VRDPLLEKYETMFQYEGDNPRTEPSRHAHMVKYIIYFNQDRRGEMHKHLGTAIQPPIHKGLMRFRPSCTDLWIHDHTRDIPQRICTFSWPHGRLEDELHLLFECPVYYEIIKWYPTLFNQSYANMNNSMNLSDQNSVFFISACMSRCHKVMLDIAPPIIHCITRGLNNFSTNDDSDRDSERKDPSDQPILWGPEDEVYHDDALVYTMSRPPHLQVYRFFD
jgi:hypothetical protein